MELAIFFRIYPDSVEGSSKPKNRENCMVKRRENSKWSLVTGRCRCFLHQTWAMETTGLWTKMCYERQRSLNEHSQSLRKRVQGGATYFMNQKASLPPSGKKNKLEAWSRLTDTDFHCGWFHTGSEFTLVQKYSLDVSHRSHCLGILKKIQYCYSSYYTLSGWSWRR